MSALNQLTTKHTKGEWRTGHDGFGNTVITAMENRSYKPVCIINKKKNFAEQQANTSLIKTAPEMLKTLNALRGAIFNHGQNIKKIDPVEWFDRISQVIGSATS